MNERWFEVVLEVNGAEREVREFSLSESLSGEARLLATLLPEDGVLPSAAELLGKSAKLHVRSWTGSERFFAGFVASAVERRLGHNPVLDLMVLSSAARLALRKNCRTFQNMTPDAIVTQVLADASVENSGPKFQLSEAHPARDYVVQYRETDLAFLLRLLAEEGIYFAQVFGEDGLELAFTDDPRGLSDVDGETALPFSEEFGFERDDECIYQLSQRQRTTTDKVFVRDRDFTKPDLMLEAPAESTDPGTHALEAYEYPGRFQVEGEAQRNAQNLLAGILVDRLTVSGLTTSLRLLPGRRFKVEDHPWGAMNQEILVTSSTLRASGLRRPTDGGARTVEASLVLATFEGVPTGRTRYRPKRVEAALRVPGLQTAMTTGASGEAIHVDEHGRVKAHFHWDRLGKSDDSCSSWMRTSQAPLGGAMLLPRVGWEVGVAFAEGDPDRPYVMHRYYNGGTAPPYALPEHKASMALQTGTTPGDGSSNEFSMSDTKGKEGMFFNGSRDMSVGVGNNATESVKNDQAVTVGSKHELHVAGAFTSSIGSDESLTVSGNQERSVGTLMVDDSGTLSVAVGGNRNLSIGGDHRRTVAGPSTLTVGGNSIDLVAGSVFESTLASMTHSVGSALIDLCAGSRSVVVGGLRSETTGALKAVVAKKSRGLEAAVISDQVGGALVAVVKGDRVDTTKAAYSDLAAGLQITKAKSIVLEAQNTLVVQMGAASLVLSPASISITGAAIKLDGNTVDTGIVMDN